MSLAGFRPGAIVPFALYKRELEHLGNGYFPFTFVEELTADQ